MQVVAPNQWPKIENTITDTSEITSKKIPQLVEFKTFQSDNIYDPCTITRKSCILFPGNPSRDYQ